MKNVFLLLLWSINFVLPGRVSAQEEMPEQYTTSKDDSKKTESTYAVPDVPAFNALQLNPSNILRPSNIRTIATDMAPFIEGGHFTIPKGFAMEISPGALIYRDRILNVADYKKKGTYLAYNTTVSVATGLNETNEPSKIALGWRTNFYNQADKFTNKEHRAAINGILMKATQGRNAYWLKWKEKNKKRFIALDADLKDKDKWGDLTLSADNEKIQSLLEKFSVTDSAVVNDAVEKADRDFENRMWNACRFDAAAAFVLQAEDDHGKNMKPSQIHGWLTGAVKLHEHGQLLIGVYGHAGFDKEKKDESNHIIMRPEWEFSASFRFYAGVNKYKFLAEYQQGIKQMAHVQKAFQTNSLAIGTEVGVYNLVWLSLYGGFKDMLLKDGDNGDKSLTSGYLRFDWKLTIPDWAKFRN